VHIEARYVQCLPKIARVPELFYLIPEVHKVVWPRRQQKLLRKTNILMQICRHL